MAIVKKVKSFANETSMHGAAKVILSKSPVKRALWLLIFVGAWTMFISQTAMVMIDYFSYPKKVSVAVVKAKDDRVPFPDVTVCNMRPLNFHAVKKLEDYYYNHGSKTLAKTGDSFVDAYSMTVAMAFRLSEQVNENATSLDVTRSDIKMNMLPEILENNTISKEEFIVQCRFLGEGCEEFGTISQVSHGYYFRCFTFTTNVALMTKGPTQGLSLTLMSGNGMLTNEADRDSAAYIPGMYKINSTTSGSEGVRVVVHPPNTAANPIIEGIDVPPGYSVSLGLKPNRYIRAKKPHGDCVDDNPFVTQNRFAASSVKVPYRQVDCILMCYQTKIIKKCGCYDFNQPILSGMNCTIRSTSFNDSVIERVVTKACDIFDDDGNVRQTVYQCGDLTSYCNSSASYEECENATMNESVTRRAEMSCVEAFYDEEIKAASCSDQCPFPCSEYEYDVTYSLSKWPAKGTETQAVYYEIFGIAKYLERFRQEPEKYSFYKEYKEKMRNKILDDFLQLKVYWFENKVVTTEESALYSLPSLISDIGGQFGIWIGVSVITLSELMELLFSTCVGVFRRRNKKEEDAEVGNTSDELEETKVADNENKDAEDKDKNAEEEDKDVEALTGVSVE